MLKTKQFADNSVVLNTSFTDWLTTSAPKVLFIMELIAKRPVSKHCMLTEGTLIYATMTSSEHLGNNSGLLRYVPSQNPQHLGLQIKTSEHFGSDMTKYL